jgi:predicted nucleotidyltransferase
MRLEPEEIVAIKACAIRAFGEGVKVYLYGSRADDAKRGGDIDLLIETPNPERATFQGEADFRYDLERLIGERKIDILLRSPDKELSTIEDIAYGTGVRLL